MAQLEWDFLQVRVVLFGDLKCGTLIELPSNSNLLWKKWWFYYPKMSLFDSWNRVSNVISCLRAEPQRFTSMSFVRINAELAIAKHRRRIVPSCPPWRRRMCFFLVLFRQSFNPNRLNAPFSIMMFTKKSIFFFFPGRFHLPAWQNGP